MRLNLSDVSKLSPAVQKQVAEALWSPKKAPKAPRRTIRLHKLPDDWEAAFPGLVAEHRFHPDRKWRFDFAWPQHKIALEIEGGLFINGGHSRGSGVTRDHQKFNEAAMHGWRVVKVQPRDLKANSTYNMLRRLMPNAQ